MTAESGDKRRPDPDEPAVISPITRRTFLRGALATAGATILLPVRREERQTGL